MTDLAWGAAMALASVPLGVWADEREPLEVDVRGDALPHAADEPTTATTVVEKDALDRPGLTSVEALARVPGVQIGRTGSAADVATVTLRGATGAQMPVYLAGVRLNDEFHGAADLSTVPVFFLRRIEVHRGHAPIELDRGGLGGAILLEPEVPSEPSVGVSFGAGSFGERSVSVFGAAGGEDAAAAVAVRAASLEGDFPYLDDRGTRFDPSDDREAVRRNGDASEVDAWTALRVRLGRRGSWAGVVNGFSREQGVPGLGIVPALRARTDRTRANAASRLHVLCGRTPSEACSLRLTTVAKRTTYLLRDPDRELPFSTERQSVLGSLAGAELAFTEAPFEWLEVEAGAAEAIESLAVDPEGPAETRARRLSARAFTTLAFRPVGVLELRAAGAIEAHRTRAAGAQSGVTAPIGRAGAAVRPIPWLRVFATAGRYVRVPTLGEQYGGAAGVLGNPELVFESGPAADVGAHAELPGLSLVRLGGEIVFFGRLATDLIAFRRSAAGVLRPFNVGDARVLGVEASVAGRFFDLLVVEGAATFTDPRDVTEGRTLVGDLLPYQAPFVGAARLAVEARPAPAARWDEASLGASFVYRSPRVADPAGLVELPSQVLLDLDASLGLDRGMVRVRGRVSNVLDDDTTDFVGYPLPGRAGHVEVEGRWP